MHVLSKGAWRALTHPCGLLMVASGISIREQSSTLKKFADKVALNRWDFNGCCSELYLPTVCACAGACGDDHYYISLHLLLSPLGIITLHVTRENLSCIGWKGPQVFRSSLDHHLAFFRMLTCGNLSCRGVEKEHLSVRNVDDLSSSRYEFDAKRWVGSIKDFYKNYIDHVKIYLIENFIEGLGNRRD